MTEQKSTLPPPLTLKPNTLPAPAVRGGPLPLPLRGRGASEASAGRWRGGGEFGVDGGQAGGPGELGEVHRLAGDLLALRPFAEAAEIAVVDLVERDRPKVGVPLLARRRLAQAVRRLGISGDGGEILLRLLSSLQHRAQEARDLVGAVGAGQELRPRPGDEIALDIAAGIREDMRLVRAALVGARSDGLPAEERVDVAVAVLEGLERRGAGREDAVVHVEPLLLEVAVGDRHPDRIVVHRRLAEQRDLLVLRRDRRGAEAEAGDDRGGDQVQADAT